MPSQLRPAGLTSSGAYEDHLVHSHQVPEPWSAWIGDPIGARLLSNSSRILKPAVSGDDHGKGEATNMVWDGVSVVVVFS